MGPGWTAAPPSQQLVEIHQRMLETKEERAKRKRAEQDGELEDDAFSQPMLGAAGVCPPHTSKPRDPVRVCF